MDNDSLENYNKLMIKLYDDFQPIRDMITNFPELKQPIVKFIADVLNEQSRKNFYGPFLEG